MKFSEAPRLILLMIFAVSLFMLGENWYKQYWPKQESIAVVGKPGGLIGDPSPIPESASTNVPATVQPRASSDASDPVTPVPSAIFVVQTDVIRAEIAAIGGDLRRIELLKHRDTINAEQNFLLMDSSAEHTLIAQTGLIGSSLPNHKSVFAASVSQVVMKDGENEVKLVLTSTDAGKPRLTKVYTFARGQYRIDVSQTIENTGASALTPFAYFQLVRDDKAPAGDSRWVPTFNGVAQFTEQDKYQKMSFGDIAKGKAVPVKTSQDGWIGMVQHYFVSAWLPPPGAPKEFFVRSLGGGFFAAGVIVPVGRVEAGKSATWSVPLYAGPQEQKKLASLAPGLDLTVDYGWLTIIAAPLFWLLSTIHGVVRNWGVAIIIVTVLIKLLFFPLSAASYKSMAKMRLMAPKLQKLKELHGDDKPKLHQAMMQLYKTEKINPLGGCLPIVVQIPVFISLYWVLLGTVEMRHAPFMLWVQDLSRPDPFYVLPILMGLSMIIQSRLNPEPPDPIQAKVMKIMPIAFSVFFFFFPAGLVLYWVINNVLSIAQQWTITRQLERVGLGAGKR